MHPLRFGLKLSQAATLDTLKALWRVADDSGFDHCWNMDHLASLDPDDSLDIFEAWTLLAGKWPHRPSTPGSAVRLPATSTATPPGSRRHVKITFG